MARKLVRSTLHIPMKKLHLALLITSLTTSFPTWADLKQTLDWVPISQLTESQKSQLPLGSCGAYISPIQTNNSNPEEQQNAPTEALSNSTKTIDNNGFKEIQLIGDVIVKKGYQQLTADEATYSEKTGTIVIDGALTVRQPDLLLLAKKGIVNQQEDSLNIEEATYVIHSAGIRGSGKQLSKNKHIIDIQQSQYTSCEPGNSDWILKGSSIVIDTEANQGKATNVRLIVKGIPIFYWPYLRFPVGNERQSGFLFPSLSLSSGGSNELSIPYYLNLAPNYDLIFTPHFLSDHGVLLENNFRHLHSHFETDINFSYLGDDKGKLSDSEASLVNSGQLTEAQANPFTGEDRWSFNIDQVGGNGKKWYSKIDFSKVSDNDYLEDFDSSSLNSNSDVSLVQQFTLGYNFKHWNIELDNTQYQLLDDNITDPYKQLPQLTFNGKYELGNIEFNLENQWTRFDRDDANTAGSTVIVGDRTRLKYSAGFDNEWEAGFLRPRIQMQHLSYQLNNNNLFSTESDSASITVPQAVIDSGLYFERDGSSYLQTFEPRLFYFHSPFENQNNLTGTRNIRFDTSDLGFSYNQLFRDTRFSGGDLIDDANQLSIGLTTRFIGNSSGRELFSANIGKAIYFDERRVTLSGNIDTDNNSPIAALITANINDQWQLSNDTIYDDDINEVTSNTASIKYRNSNGVLFNYGHRYTRQTSQQAEISFITPLADNTWALIAHARYDYTNNRELEQLWGIEYHSCCYRARFGYKKTVDDDQVVVGNNNFDYDESFIIELQFFGLGGTGKQFDRIFDDAIEGYEAWQATYRTNNN